MNKYIEQAVTLEMLEGALSGLSVLLKEARETASTKEEHEKNMSDLCDQISDWSKMIVKAAAEF